MTIKQYLDSITETKHFRNEIPALRESLRTKEIAGNPKRRTFVMTLIDQLNRYPVVYTRGNTFRHI